MGSRSDSAVDAVSAIKTIAPHAGGYRAEVLDAGVCVRWSAPQSTVTAAERIADALPEPWSPVYERHPLPGSRFYRAVSAGKAA